MPALPISLHEALCSKRARIGLCCAGAGASLLSAFLLRPGASKYFIEAEFPYEEAAIENCLGMPVPGGFVSKNTAMALATRSYMMAAKDHLWWKESNLTTSEMIGIGISAVLASDRMHRGEQRAEVVMIAESACYYFEIRFDKGLGEEDRASQEEQLRCLVLERLEAHLEGGIFGEDCTAELTEQLHQRPLFYASGRRAALPDVGGAYLMPASLNPLHDGHRSMLRLAEHWRAAQREHSQDLEVLAARCGAAFGW